MNDIVIYKDGTVFLETTIEDESVWLSQKQLAELFDVQRPAITKHLSNIFKNGELDKKVVCSKMEHTTQHGAIKGKVQSKSAIYYNLDAIISIGYRVNSKRATQFRIWATSILKQHLLKGYTLDQKRLDVLEEKQLLTDKKLDTVLQAIDDSSLKPKQGIFYNGEVFDAHVFVLGLIKKADTSIVLIDNYIDESTLTLFSKNQAIEITIYTSDISKQLALDLKKYNTQYKPITIKTFKDSHDGFVIIDNKETYHIGASLKDLGKKWFAFSKLDIKSFEMLQRLKS